LNKFRIYLLNALSGKKNARLWAKMLTLILFPFGFVYSVLMFVRRYLFDTNFFKSTFLSVPVISIGNISLGGTGKTPVLIWLLRKLIEKNLNPAVISRGYGSSNSNFTLVSDGKGNILTSPPASDESVMLSRLFPNVPIITGTDRILSGEKVISSFNVDVVLIDDGFQYLKLKRNFDFLLFHGKNPFGNGRVFPSGILREPISHSKYADAFLVTGEDKEKGEQNLASLNLTVPIFKGELTVEHIFCPEQESYFKLEDIKSSRILAFSGIGNPDSFDNILEKQGITIIEHLKFPDHVFYCERNLEKIRKKTQELNPDYMITTQKDVVKLDDFKLGVPLLVLTVKMKIDNSDSLWELILKKIC
tara:strand:- start:3055 stop:4137 length:1083 start_codon:yes stop_codon:yes gene_type:complete